MPYLWESKRDQFRAETWNSNEWVLCDLSENGCIGVVKAEAYLQGLRKRMGRRNYFMKVDYSFKIFATLKKKRNLTFVTTWMDLECINVK